MYCVLTTLLLKLQTIQYYKGTSVKDYYAAQLRNANGMTPLLVMGVICKNVIPCKDYQQDDDARSDIVTLIVLQDNIHVLSVK